MGLFGMRRHGSVRGTARVVSASRAPNAAFYGRLVMDLVVEAPGVPAYSHDYRKLLVRVAKWPTPGDVLPVEVDPTDLSRVRVMWDEVPTNADAARERAERMAARVRQRHGHASANGPPPSTGEAVDPEVATIVDRLQQVFPDGVIKVNGTPVDTWATPRRSDTDPIERLDTLVRLRDTGVIDETQFARLRAQILEQSGVDP
jgi:hypothetical protein